VRGICCLFLKQQGIYTILLGGNDGKSYLMFILGSHLYSLFVIFFSWACVLINSEQQHVTWHMQVSRRMYSSLMNRLFATCFVTGLFLATRCKLSLGIFVN
jgi:hypothetical protein